MELKGNEPTLLPSEHTTVIILDGIERADREILLKPLVLWTDNP